MTVEPGVREAVDDVRGADPEAAGYIAEIADEMVADPESETVDGFAVTHLTRSPTGRLVPAVPLTEPIGAGTRPFHRLRAAEPAPRWVAVFLTVCAVLFVPYIVVLGLTLPSHLGTAHYREAWVGLDVMELLAIVATAWFAFTRSTWIAISASMACSLIVADAWFDAVGARDGTQRALAIAEAVVVELPFAAFCLWIARHAEVVADRATRLLLRRSARQAELLRDITRELER